MANRFRAVEMGIFAVVSLIFLNSVYSLFTDGKFAGESERRPLAAQADPRDSTAEARQPASAAATVDGSEGAGVRAGAGEKLAGFIPYETRCQSSGEVFETDAAKVRILGPFCGAPVRQPADTQTTAPAADGQYRVENTTTRFAATVFSDTTAGKFSTDFIPLDNGPNKIHMEFKYKGGKIYPVDLLVNRRSAP